MTVFDLYDRGYSDDSIIRALGYDTEQIDIEVNEVLDRTLTFPQLRRAVEFERECHARTSVRREVPYMGTEEIFNLLAKLEVKYGR